MASVYNYDPFSLYLYRKGGPILKGRFGFLILLDKYAKVLKRSKTKKLNPMLRAEIAQYLASSKNKEKELERVMKRISSGNASENEALVIKDLVENGVISFEGVKKDELIEALNNYTSTASTFTRMRDTVKSVVGSLPKWLKWTELISGGLALSKPIIKVASSILSGVGSAIGGAAGTAVEGTKRTAESTKQGYNDAVGNQNEDTQSSDTIKVTPVVDDTGLLVVGYKNLNDNTYIPKDSVENNTSNGKFQIVNQLKPNEF